uniref:Secreted protein n=1 Tax=Brugia timori TaxID=42155 RepID=A0A0R3RCE1_9BILA
MPIISLLIPVVNNDCSFPPPSSVILLTEDSSMLIVLSVLLQSSVISISPMTSFDSIVSSSPL